MISNPKISLILPFYNAESTLNRAIKSVSNQTFQDFECILIDNNSIDKSFKIAQDWCEKDNRFQLISEPEQGVMFASNAGCNIAKGKYIARMDADDESLPNRLELQYNFLEKNTEFGIVTGLVNYVSHRENTEGLARYVNWVNGLTNHEKIFNQRFVDSPIINPSAMWRKEIGDRYGLYESGDFPEDYEMWLRWLANGIKVGKVNEYLLKWYDSDTRLTRTHPIYSDEAFYKIKTVYLSRFLAEENPHHPKVAVWGASRISRKWVNLLEENGIEVSFYIDTKRGRKLDKPVVYYTDIPNTDECFILVYMKHFHHKKRINKFLNSRNYMEGRDFLHLS